MNDLIEGLIDMIEFIENDEMLTNLYLLFLVFPLIEISCMIEDKLKRINNGHTKSN